MLSLATFLSLLGVSLAGVQWPPTLRATLFDQLHVATHVYSTNGQIVSAWTASTRTTAAAQEVGTVGPSLCVFRSGTERPANGWLVSVTPVRQTAGRVLARVDWSRSRYQGNDTNTPRGSVELSLGPGDRVPLDAIAASAIPVGSPERNCQAVSMVLQVEFIGPAGRARGLN